MCEQTYEWDTRLEYFILAHNTMKNNTTNFPPFLLFFTKEIKTPFTIHKQKIEDLNEFIKNKLVHLQEIQKIAHEKQKKDGTRI